MRRSWVEELGAAIVLLLVASCTSEVPDGVLSFGSAEPAGRAAEQSLEVHFLATSGFLLRDGESALLTDPFFSNPSLLEVLLPSCLEPSAARIDALMPPTERTEDVRAVLIGQGHYDHLMDVPYVLPRYAPKAVVYGSRTAGHLLAPFDLATVAVNGSAASAEVMGTWLEVAGASMRILPLVSEHAPQLLGMRLVTGTLEQDLEEPPCQGGDWLQGEAFAYVVDWLGPQGEVRFRVHFQDSSTNAPFAFHPPELLDDGVPVDIAFLPIASFSQVEGYPEALVQHLKPRHVVLHHWDDFMVDPREDPVVLRGQDLPEFLRRLEAVLPDGVGWSMPARGATLHFSR